MSTSAGSEDLVTLGILAWLGAGVAIAYARRFHRTARRALDRRHNRRMDLARAQAPRYVITAGQPPATLPGRHPHTSPGPCQHRNAVPVHTLDGDVVAWLCRNPGCGERLPAGWAVLDTDLDERT